MRATNNPTKINKQVFCNEITTKAKNFLKIKIKLKQFHEHEIKTNTEKVFKTRIKF